MLTVVLASDEAAPFLKEYDMLFQPFVQAGQLAFCRWNRQGRDFAPAGKGPTTSPRKRNGPPPGRIPLISSATPAPAPAGRSRKARCP